MSSDWKNLQNLASNKFPGFENKPGIYFIRWKKYETPVTINRLGGSDSNGLLYVGESKDLRRRVQRIWRGIESVYKTTSKTTNTLRITIMFCKLHEEINSNEYEIAWQHFSTKIEAQIQEAAALKLYAEKFKEPPPLNLNLCREKYAIWGFNYFDQSTWTAKPNEFVKSIIS
jgi:predicted GIY-YIG superfamily endonuclease